MIVPDSYVEEHEMTLEEVKAALEEYERKYGMTSQEFYEKWKKGETEWVDESVVWRGLIESYKALNGSKRDDIAATETDFDLEERDMTVEEVNALLQKFERKYGMTSQDFSKKWEKGETDWVADSVAWITLFESYQALNGHDV